jgi:hypothetical protein
MAPPKVTVEWRRGVNGDQGTYVFDPKPSIQLNAPNKRVATFFLPFSDGAAVQVFGTNVRTITLKGLLFVPSVNFNLLDQKRKDLVAGIGTGPGQLHIIATGNHIYYKAIPSPDGIVFDPLERANILGYTITLLAADPTEFSI